MRLTAQTRASSTPAPVVDRSVVEHVEDVDRQLEYGNVVDVVANIAPRAAESRQAATSRLADRGNLGTDCGKALLESQGVEQHQATDPQGRGSVLFLVGPGDEIGYAVRDAGMARYLSRRLLEREPNDLGRGGHAVRSLQFERERVQLVGKPLRGPGSEAARRHFHAARAVNPPFEIRGGFEGGKNVVLAPQPHGIQNAYHSQSFREVF